MKRNVGLGILCYLLLLIFVANDAWIYEKPIAKIINITEEKTGIVDAVHGGEECYYKQKLKVKLLNTKEKGKTLVVVNEYTSSRVIGQKYHKGDKVLLNSQEGKAVNSIRTQKRDTYLAALFGGIIFLLILFTGKQGIRTCFTLAVNGAIYILGFIFYLKGNDILQICNLLVLVFTAVTLWILNGFHRKTAAAIVSTLCVFLLIMTIFTMTLHHTTPLDYTNMEYLGSIGNPEDLFLAEVMFAGLGAIMDVAVTLAASMEELIRKKPDISMKALFRSGREVGYDIMGTMINVLLFTFAAGLIPSFIIRMNNEIPFFTNIRFYIPFEISRFLIESIGIVAAIPISIVVASICFKWSVRRERSL